LQLTRGELTEKELVF